MSTPPKSLSARVSWLRLLGQLEIAVPSPVLPAIFLRCPLCKQERLTIMEDHVGRGQWFACGSCGETGDMIELAAKAWGLSITGTIIKLTRRGFDLPIDDASIHGYLIGHVEYRKSLVRLWQQAQPYFDRHNTLLRPLLYDLGLAYDIPPHRWERGPAMILGGLDTLTIEKTFHPYLLNGTRQTSARRTFAGGNWRDVLVFPFYAAPQRIVAYGFIGRQGRMERDYVFRVANIFNSSGGTVQPEAGLAMHPQTQEIAADWGKCIFAVSDPLLYLDLHLRQFSYSNNAIPLVLWQDQIKPPARTQHAWRMFRDRKIIFWDPSLSVPTLQQAIAVNGWIALTGPRQGGTSLRNYHKEDMPSAICRLLQRKAKPWPKALASLMLQWTDSQIEDLFLQIPLNALQLGRVRRACRPGLRDRFNEIMASHNIGNNVPVDGGGVVAQDDGWYAFRDSDRQRQLTQICNAQIRLDRVVTYRKPGCSVYSGVVRIQGEDVPFAAPQRAFEVNPFRWLQQYLASQHKGPLHYESRWSNRVIHIAAQFHQPTTVPGVVSVGWNDKRLHFAIPGYRIGIDGVETVPDLDVPMPAVGMVLQDSITDAWGDCDDYGSALYWATLGCILDDVLAPALLRKPRGIGLLGLGAQTIGASVAQAAGCMSRTIRGPAQLRTVLADERRHHWPIHVELPLPKNGSKVRGWLTKSFPRNCITPVRASQPGWWTITGEEPAKVHTRLLELTKRIVPAYLKDVCKRRLQVEDVHEDLAGFIARQGGTMDLDQVRNVLRVTAGQPDTETHGENAVKLPAGQEKLLVP